MNTYRYDEQQIRAWVNDKVRRTKSVKQICQEAVISRATLYNWLKEFSQEETINTPAEIGNQTPVAAAKTSAKAGMKIPVTDPAARYQMIVSSLKKADMDGAVSRKLVAEIVKRYTVTVAQACEIIGIDESVYGYKPRKPEVDDQWVYDEFSRLIAEDPSRGFIECYEILQATHPDWTRKQLKRIYRERRLYLQRKRKTRKGYATEIQQDTDTLVAPPVRLYRPGATWTLGIAQQENTWVLFVLDNEDGTPLNAKTGEGEIIYEDVLAFLDVAAEENGTPKKLRLFAKEPFTNREITRWVWDNKVALHNLSLGKPENMEEMEQVEHGITNYVFAVSDTQAAIDNWLNSFVIRCIR